MRLLFLSFMLLASLPALGQISPEKLAMGRMEKGKWQKVEQSLRKSLSKDTLNPEARYLLSIYYFSVANPAYNLDSAHAYSLTAQKTYARTPIKERDRLKRVPLDSTYISLLRGRIDSAAFEKAKRLNTEPSYQYFIDHYTTARQRTSAEELRDEVAFLEALKVNTWSSFQKFMMKYPASHRKGEAQRRYDKLLFDDHTKDQRLASFIKFHRQFVASPYRPIAEKNIFELSTASGSPDSFLWFIENYSTSKWSVTAKNILYKLQSADEKDIFDPAWLTDSLRHAEELNKSYWVTVIKSGRYGFIDQHGTEVIAPKFENVSADYRCGDVKDRLLATSNGLIARNEKVLWPGGIHDVKELGAGFVLLTTDSGRHVIHESGFRIGAGNLQGGQLVANRFVGLQKNNKWAIYSLAGKEILPFSLDEIVTFDSLVVLSKGGKKILTTPGRLGRMADQPDAREDFVFDDVRRWAPQRYWVRNGVLEGVIDASLNFVIPLDRQILRKMSFGFLYGKDDNFYVKGISRLEKTPYKSVNEQAGWIRLQTSEGRHLLYDRGFDQMVAGDSVWFQGQLAFVQLKDSIRAFLPSGQKLSFFGHSSFQFKEFKDSSAWLVLDDKKKKSVYDAASGVKLFSMEFDQLEAISAGIFLVNRLGKKGLVGEDGRILVPIEYDAIVATENDSFSLLKEKKFGWYDARSGQLIKPAFDRNIKSYNKSLQMAFKGKGYGFIHPDGTALGIFEWEEIQYWNDSSAWVKKNFQWMLMTIHSQKVKLDRIRNFETVSDTQQEKIFIVSQDNALGVVSNRKGIVIPIQYSDIVNLGSKEVPLYFTERNIEEAAISVVVYYDQGGKIIRKQAMEADEFERIYCDN